MIDEVKELFKNWNLKRGGSYIFEKEENFRPNWLSGDRAHSVRIFYIKEWMKVEFFINGEFWEKFYEGGVNTIDDVKYILNLLEVEIT